MRSSKIVVNLAPAEIKKEGPYFDLPIAIGISVIFLRSAFEIITQTGSGFFDCGSGLVFFMLIVYFIQLFILYNIFILLTLQYRYTLL